MLDKLASRSGHSKTMHVYVCEGRRNDIFLRKPNVSFLPLRSFLKETKSFKYVYNYYYIVLSNYGKSLSGFPISASLYEASRIMSPGQTKRRKNLFFSIHSDGHFWGVLMRIKVKLNNNLVQFTDLAISFLLFFMKIAPFFPQLFSLSLE